MKESDETSPAPEEAAPATNEASREEAPEDQPRRPATGQSTTTVLATAEEMRGPVRGQKLVDSLRAAMKSKWVALKGWLAEQVDYFYPRLEPLSETQKQKQQDRFKCETGDLDARIVNSDAEALVAALNEFRGLLATEADRRASVDSRLSTIMGLTSVVAAITFGALTFRAGTGFQYPQSWAVWAAAATTLYIVLQLICAIQAALRGLSVRTSEAVNYDDLIPQLEEAEVTHGRRALKRSLKCLHDQQENNNARVSQLMVAHVALRNFLFGVAALTAALVVATLVPSHKEKDIVKELRADPELYDALRGRVGKQGDQGPPGKDGAKGEKGEKGEKGDPVPTTR